MKILLVGEYSRLHNSLKEGLVALGQDVILIGSNDGFKDLPTDISISSKLSKYKPLKLCASFIYKIFKVNIIAIEGYILWYFKLRQLKGFDVVQVYNESIAKTYINLEKRLFKLLKKNNKKLFLLSCGIDYINVKFAENRNYKYSILTPLHKDESLETHYKFILNKLKAENRELSHFISSLVDGIIASDMDYHLPLENNSKYLGLAPNPVNINKLSYKSILIDEKIVIFHGINTSSYIRKGNIFFDRALDMIRKKYSNKIEIIITKDLPYKDYIKSYENCHILLDQVYAYDQGYNALEAMAKGKVVFTGAEEEWLNYYNIAEDTIAINALPDVDSIVRKLELLIENPNKIIEISKNARRFIEQEHNYKHAAQRYIKLWSQS